MRVLVTGGAGYIGSHICRLLRDRNIPHIAYDNLSTGHAQQLDSTPMVEGDIADSEALSRAFEQFKPDTVIHLAALATLSGCAADPALCERTNITGLKNLLAAMQAHGASRLVHASSCAVYAPSAAPLAETSPLAPESLYGQSKLEGERLIAASGIPHIMLRLFNVAGAHPDGSIGECHHPETHLIPLAIDAALGKRPPLAIYGDDYPTQDGTAVRDYVHVMDVAAAFLHAAGHLAGGGISQPVNCGSGLGTSVRELLAMVECHTGRTVPHTTSPRREGDVAHLLCDATRLKALGWAPSLDIAAILASAVGWHR